jgi:ribonucleotide reductase beta subunit family protein with ferritin-like domain
MGVEADENDFRTRLTEGEKHAVLTLQSILTQYELIIGGTEMWGGKITKMFPRLEIQRMCSEFSHAELCSHAPFYKIGNQVLNQDTDEFYNSCKEIPELSVHIKYIESQAKSKNPLEVTAALCFLEGVVLFSAFAFFKSFNTNGYNLIPHFVAGIDASAKDENFHAMGSAWLYNTCKLEREALGIETHSEDLLHDLAYDTYLHECAIIDLIYSVKPESIRTIEKEDLKSFIRDRIDLVLSYLNGEPYFSEPKGIISEWFYDNLSQFKYSDFFASTQVQYTKNWDKNALTFDKEAL